MKYYKIVLVASFTAFSLKSIVAQTLKPGDIAPNAKAIDAIDLFPFNMGAAIVRKGIAYGLIDMTGNFIVPYNKYTNISSLYPNGIPTSGNGLFLVDIEMGAINSKGKLITEAFPKFRWSLGSDDGKLIKAFEKPIYLDADGHQYVLKQYLEHIVDGIGIAKDAKDGLKKGYKNLKDEWVVNPVYDFAGPFSEGMACVGKGNEFGEIKYGFVDKTGKEVIGLIYSNKPDDFHGGLARVIPKSNAEFKQAYIDKKGNIVQKMNDVVFYKYAGNGLYIEDLRYTHVMDSTGKIVTNNEFLQQFGVVLNPSTDKAFSLGSELFTDIANYNDGRFCFTRSLKTPGPSNFGTINLKTKVVIEGSFEVTRSLGHFDPVSKLAYAKFYISRDFKDKTPPREGYVNEQGIFVIVKGATSQW